MNNTTVKLSSTDLSLVYKPGGYSRKQDNRLLLFATRYDITLADVLEIKAGYDKARRTGTLYSADNNFEAWFYDHCMARMERPVEALEAFRESCDPEVRGIAIKALRDRYGVTEADRLSRAVATYTMWSAVAALAAASASIIALLK